MAHPQAEALATAFISHFWAANHEIEWAGVEREAVLWLADDVVLVGRIDAEGITPDGRPFFADWKTASASKAQPKRRDELKSQWRMNPQSLTYGLLSPGVHDFTVRWMFKTEPPGCDHEWYTFSQDEIAWWHGELINFAREIRERRAELIIEAPNWPTNLNNCTRFGEKYKCPFRDQGCWALNFSHVPEGMKVHVSSEITERLRHGREDDLVILSATKVNDFVSCRELYRRRWEKNGAGWGLTEEGEALTIGKDAHEIIAGHIKGIMEEKNGRASK